MCFQGQRLLLEIQVKYHNELIIQSVTVSLYLLDLGVFLMVMLWFYSIICIPFEMQSHTSDFANSGAGGC